MTLDPAWRHHGRRFALHVKSGRIVDVGIVLQDWGVAALNLCEGATPEQLNELRTLGVTPVHIVGAAAVTGKAATIVQIADWIKRKGGQLP
jgi:hypothetical protein